MRSLFLLGKIIKFDRNNKILKNNLVLLKYNVKTI